MASRTLACCRKALQSLPRTHTQRLAAAAILQPHLRLSSISNRQPARSYSSEASSSTPVGSNERLKQQGQSTHLSQHLNSLFFPLQFPPELAARILTHASHKDAVVSHNARLGFIGRRVLRTYLGLMLHSAPAISGQHDYNLIIDRALNTYVLGEHIAPKWSLETKLRWKPVQINPTLGSGDYTNLDPSLLKGVGLYKVQGTAVEAVMGGIFHQFGGAVAHQIFHTRLLPHILLPGNPAGLHDAYHGLAMKICDKMGGVGASLNLPGVQRISPNNQKVKAESLAQ